MKKTFIWIIVLVVIVVWVLYNNYTKTIPVDHVQEIITWHVLSNIHTNKWTYFSEENGYELLTGTTYINIYKLPQELLLYGDLSNPVISYSGNIIAKIENNNISYKNLQLELPLWLKWWKYYLNFSDNDIQSWQQYSWTLSLSESYFDPNITGKSLILYRGNTSELGFDYWFCSEENDKPWEFASDPAVYFSTGMVASWWISTCIIHRVYDRKPEQNNLKTSRHTMMILSWDWYYSITLDNYSLEQAQQLFDSLEIK